MMIGNKEALELLIKADKGYTLNAQEESALKKVMILTLEKPLTTIPKSIGKLSSLETLSFGTAEISKLPKEIGTLISLKYIYLHNQRIKKLPDTICNLKKLIVLDISNTDIDALPTHIGELESLESLDLSSTEITKFPSSFVNLRSLKELDLSSTSFSELPNSFGDLYKLEKLFLGSTNLEALPDSFIKLTSLKTLDLSNVKITSFPTQVFHLPALKNLNLRGTPISVIPDSIGHMAPLKNITLSNTALTSFPLPLFHLSTLESINLDGIPMKVLPQQIGNMTSLKTLRLCNTSIDVLPSSLRQLHNLETLDLTNTPITELPSFILELTKLQTLNLANTKIFELPEDGWDKLALDNLNLSSLSLDIIPQSLAQSKYASFTDNYTGHGICLQGTSLSKQNVEIFLHSPALIPDLYSKDRVRINECKVIFLGDGASGKSYTIQRILNDGAAESPNNPYITKETPGVEISDYFVKSEDNLCLHFWDFGGQELLQSMHRCFLTEKTCYVVTVKSRETKGSERAIEWLQNIQMVAPNSPVILFINCWDNDDGERVIDQTRITKEFPNIKEVVFCSATKSTRESFNAEIRDKIIKMVKDSGYLDTEIYSKWNQVQLAIQKDAANKNYLTKEEYHSICSKYGIDNDQNTDLLTFFNNIGVCFSYHIDKNRKELAEYKLLDPRWLTNALSAILEEGKTHSISGKINIATIEKLLCTPVKKAKARRPIPSILYTKDECGYIIDVAIAHDLCYKLDEYTLFIPSLCDKDTPDTALDFQKDHPDAVKYKFDYTFLPPNCVHQLMIKLMNNGYSLSEQWFTGMLINIANLCKIMISTEKQSLFILYVSESDSTLSLFPLLRGYIVETNTELNLKANESIITEGDIFSMNRLIKAKENHITLIDGEEIGVEVNVWETLTLLYSITDISRLETNGQTILWRDSAFNEADYTDRVVRNAIFDAYKGTCQYCGILLSRKDFDIDHIIPQKNEESLKDADNQVKSFIKYLEKNGFNLSKPDYLENYLLSCRPNNNCKRADIRRFFVLHEYISEAIKNVPLILKFINKYRKQDEENFKTNPYK